MDKLERLAQLVRLSPTRFGRVNSMFKSSCGGKFKADKMGRVKQGY